jgi:lipopolysaccharide/colanic/teichoic acid biosynthesis glycosyltransferase
MSESSASIHPSSYPVSIKRRFNARLSDAFKRGFDILASFFGLLALAPLFAYIAYRIKRDTPGPVFYRGPRYGKHGRIFHILKFRSMREEPESYRGPRLTARDDPRITKVGRWLRDTKLNELPQLWNVLLGEMSLVGPRPEDPELGKTWPVEVRREVLSVRPGITSPASVLYRNEENLLDSDSLVESYVANIQPSKLRLDQLYVRHRSFLLDLDILFYTLLVLLPQNGAAAPVEEKLFLGPFSILVRRYVTWFVVDLLVSFAAVGLTGLFWRTLGPLNLGWPLAVLLTLLFSLLFSVMGALLGVNRIQWSRATSRDVLELLPPILATLLLVLAANYLLVLENPPLVPAEMVVTATVLAAFGFVLVRYRVRLFRSFAARWLSLRGGAAAAQERVLIVGGGESGQFIAWWLQNGRSVGRFQVVGYVDDDLYKQDTRIYGVDVLGCREDIPRLVAELDVGILVFAIHNIPAEDRRQVLEICTSTTARLLSIPDVLGSLRQATGEPVPRSKKSVAEVDDLGISWMEERLVIDGRQVKMPDVPGAYLDAWLAELFAAVQAGDLESVQTKIQNFRLRLHEDSLRAKE